MVSFLIPGDFSSRSASTLEEANFSLHKMTIDRVDRIEARDYLHSKLAWKLATLRQPMLYRVVALTESFAFSWNSGNILGAYLPARALIETSALLLELENDLRELLSKRDVPAIDALLMNRLFASRDMDWIKDHPDAKALNILTIIDRLDNRDLKGIRTHYDIMSEVCHPNLLGFRQMFGSLDEKSGTTVYSETISHADNQGSLLATMVLVIILAEVFEALKVHVVSLAKLQTSA